MKSLPLLILSSLALACSRPAEPQTDTQTTAAPTSSSTSSANVPLPPQAASSDLKWDVPATWTVATNPSPMRKATYKIPKVADDSEDAELSVTQAGGTAEANIQRWSGQFQGAPAPDVTTRDVSGMKVTLVTDHGTFASGMPGGPSTPKKNWMLYAAIVEATTPPTFFKLTGPQKTVTAARADFDKFVGSLRMK
jgi:hypothetical protein